MSRTFQACCHVQDNDHLASLTSTKVHIAAIGGTEFDIRDHNGDVQLAPCKRTTVQQQSNTTSFSNNPRLFIAVRPDIRKLEGFSTPHLLFVVASAWVQRPAREALCKRAAMSTWGGHTLMQ